MPLILNAAAAYATLGEISDRLRAVFGEYREHRCRVPPRVSPVVYARARPSL